ncbi:MAG: OmpA family protein [Phycisphaerae bacterium]|nr:OmpA family protein [Phycisphaerae bacterium]
MTRMTRIHSVCWPLVCVLISIIVTGCGPDPKDTKIQDLSAENDRLKGDLADRDRQINDALVRENDARGSIDELDRELAKLRAERSKVQSIGEWMTTPTFDMISISDSVLFDSGKAILTSTGRAKLATVASDIRSRYADRDIYIFGHTDAQPIRKSNWKDNLELGAQRSLTVARALGELGIPNTQLISASCGEFRPVVADSVNKNQPRNRRVEVFAVRRDTGTVQDTTARSTYSGD